jgi:hypothetical protein
MHDVGLDHWCRVVIPELMAIKGYLDRNQRAILAKSSSKRHNFVHRYLTIFIST